MTRGRLWCVVGAAYVVLAGVVFAVEEASGLDRGENGFSHAGEAMDGFKGVGAAWRRSPLSPDPMVANEDIVFSTDNWEKFQICVTDARHAIGEEFDEAFEAWEKAYLRSRLSSYYEMAFHGADEEFARLRQMGPLVVPLDMRKGIDGDSTAVSELLKRLGVPVPVKTHGREGRWLNEKEQAMAAAKLWFDAGREGIAVVEKGIPSPYSTIPRPIFSPSTKPAWKASPMDAFSSLDMQSNLVHRVVRKQKLDSLLSSVHGRLRPEAYTPLDTTSNIVHRVTQNHSFLKAPMLGGNPFGNGVEGVTAD